MQIGRLDKGDNNPDSRSNLMFIDENCYCCISSSPKTGFDYYGFAELFPRLL